MRGRHRAPADAAGSRSAARIVYAAMTTGTIAATSMAVAPAAASAYVDPSPRKVDVSTPTSLLLGLTTVTVAPGAPYDVRVRLTQPGTDFPVGGQRIRIVQAFGHRWHTVRVLHTDARGWAAVTARVLTTTRIRAVYDGTTINKPSGTGVGTLYVPPLPPPAPRPVRVVPASPAIMVPATPVMARRAVAAVRPPSPSPAPATRAPAPAPTLAPSGIGARAVWLASRQAGKPYVWEAEGPYAFDCSGLTQYVYKQLGRLLPRTAQDQYGATRHVSQFQKQPGDLIFFGGWGGIYHVAVYAGNGMIWHAPHSGDVVRLSTIWTTSYLVGRVT